MNKRFETLIDALKLFSSKGYKHEIKISEDRFYVQAINKYFEVEDIVIDDIININSKQKQEKNLILYAITLTNSLKVVLIDNTVYKSRIDFRESKKILNF